MSENNEQGKISIVVDGKKSEKKPLRDRWKEQFSSRKFRGGAYSSALIVFILVAVVLVNMIIGQFNLKVDMTEEGTYTLTDQTKELLDDVKDDVTLYYIVQNGKEVPIFQNIIEKYAAESGNIKVVYKDPVLYPNFATEYAGSGTKVNDNSIVVVNEKTGAYKYIDYADMYDLDYTDVYNGVAEEPTVTAIDVEGKITSAVKIVTNEKKSVLYAVTGHGEEEVSKYLKNEYEKLGTEVKTLNIRGVGDSGSSSLGDISDLSGTEGTTATIPKDCDILYICGPNTDYSEDEVAAIKTYLQAGGKAVIMLNYHAKSMTNLYGLMEYYGLKVITGVVMENSDHSAGGYPYMTYVDITNSNSITKGIDNKTNPIFMPRAQGIQETSTRDTVTLQQVLTTTSDAYCKTASSITTYEKEDTDVMGPFHAGILVTETYEGKTSEILVFSSSDVVNDEFVQQASFGNATLMNNSIAYLTGQETGLSIPKRALKETYVNTTDANTGFYTVLLVVALPIVLLAAGFAIWYSRRRRA